jgi:hypothetical protein
MQERYLVQRRREASYAGGVVNNGADADALEYDSDALGMRYTNAGRMSRVRGGW